jgi:hypothetical protein
MIRKPGGIKLAREELLAMEAAMKVQSFSSPDKAEGHGYTQAEIEAEIRRRAYALYEQRGKADGNAVDDWLRAEAEVLEQKREWAA